MWLWWRQGRTGSPAISSDGTVYVGSVDGYLYAIGGATPATGSLTDTAKIATLNYYNPVPVPSGAFRVFLSDSYYGAAPDNDAMIYRMLNYVSSGVVPPSPPSNVSATFSDSSITVTWAAPQLGTYPIGGYAIYKGTSSGGESLTPISTVGATVTTWTDTSVVLGSTYYYYIKAYDTGSPPNYSTPSGEVPPYQVAGAIRDDGMVPAESAQLPGVPNIGI